MKNKVTRLLAMLLMLAMVFSLAACDLLGFGSGSVVAEGPDGSNCFKWSATGGWSSTSITVSPVEAGVDYIIKFKMNINHIIK